MKPSKSPYLKDRRLADIIAAIQALSVYPWAGSKKWDEKLGEPLSAKNWESLFLEHPEFFRLSGEWTTLRLRYTYSQTYDRDIVKCCGSGLSGGVNRWSLSE